MAKTKERCAGCVRKTGSILGINIPSGIVERLKLEENELVRVVIEKTRIK